MAWELPRYPTNDTHAICLYWQRIAEIPLDEPGATILREMANGRLRELGQPVPPDAGKQ